MSGCHPGPPISMRASSEQREAVIHAVAGVDRADGTGDLLGEGGLEKVAAGAGAQRRVQAVVIVGVVSTNSPHPGAVARSRDRAGNALPSASARSTTATSGFSCSNAASRAATVSTEAMMSTSRSPASALADPAPSRHTRIEGHGLGGLGLR
jgi:hypothetical protein